jgi:hypothetical protein
MKKTLLLFSLLLFFCARATAQEGGVKIFVITTTVGVKCSPKQPALWVINSGGSAGVYRCSAPNTLTLAGGGTSLTDSASLRSALSDETGTGAAVFATSPTLTTPAVDTALIMNGTADTAVSAASKAKCFFDTDDNKLKCSENGGAYLNVFGTEVYTTVQDEASDLTARPKLNFTGAGVTCVDNAGATRTDCTITSGTTYTGADDISVSGSTVGRQTLTGAGEYFSNIPLGATTTTVSMASANQVFLHRVYIPHKVTYNSITVNVGTLSGGGLMGFGVYNNACTSKLIDSGAVSTGSTGNVSTTLGAAVTLSPGFYWFGWTADNTTAALRGISINNNVVTLMNQGTVQIGVGANASAAGVLPSACGAVSSLAAASPAMIKLQN